MIGSFSDLVWVPQIFSALFDGPPAPLKHSFLLSTCNFGQGTKLACWFCLGCWAVVGCWVGKAVGLMINGLLGCWAAGLLLCCWAVVLANVRFLPVMISRRSSLMMALAVSAPGVRGRVSLAVFKIGRPKGSKKQAHFGAPFRETPISLLCLNLHKVLNRGLGEPPRWDVSCLWLTTCGGKWPAAQNVQFVSFIWDGHGIFTNIYIYI